jgi:acylphosphatase
MKSYKFIVIGKVQGVYYRVSVQNNALNSNYKGYVKNLSDGAVEACVSCLEAELPSFIKILQTGSKFSNVADIQQFECDKRFTNLFEVR